MMMGLTKPVSASTLEGPSVLSPPLRAVASPLTGQEIPLDWENLGRYQENLSAFQQLLGHVAFNRELLNAYQEGQLSALLTHAVESCSFYQQRDAEAFGDHPSKTTYFQTLPTLSKRDVQQQFLGLWSDRFIPEEHAVELNFWMTSGSTGEPTRFIVDPFSALSREVSFWLSQFLIGNETLLPAYGKPLMLRMSSNEGGGLWYKQLPFLGNALMWKMSVLNHPTCDLSAPVRFLRDSQPLLLGGDPQAFLTLIEAWQQHYPELACYPFEVRGITCGGDQLSQPARQRIESFFGIPVTDTYALSETSIVASQCRHGSMHIHWPVNMLEVADKDGNILPEGAFGELVVTNLVNWAFPFLRYRTGDLGRVDHTTQCSCGCVFPILTDFQGRKKRYFKRPDGLPFSPNGLVRIFYDAGLYQYQLVQNSPSDYTLRYIPGPVIDDPQALKTMQRILQAELESLTATSVVIHYESHEVLHTPGRKFQEFISHCQ